MKQLLRPLALCLLVGSSSASALAQAGEAPEAERRQLATRATMARIVDALSRVLPESLDPRAFADPGRHEEILGWLTILADAAADVPGHGEERDAGFGFLGRSLARDAREARERFAAFRPAEARFFVHRLTDRCMACHSRAPDDAQHPWHLRLLAGADAAKASKLERARLAVATRQFDEALTLYEELMGDPGQSPVALDAAGDLSRYLSTCVRVRGNVDRALRGLELLLVRDDVPSYLRRNVGTWADELRGLRGDRGRDPTLKRAKALLDEAAQLREFPAQRVGLVHELLAARQLVQLLDSGDGGPEDRAEMLFLLGVAEARIQPSFWESEADACLEAAIRLAPRGPHARRALELLEEHAVLAFSGSRGESVPGDVQARLDELAVLVGGR